MLFENPSMHREGMAWTSFDAHPLSASRLGKNPLTIISFSISKIQG
jgi:hypothetical protein